MRPAIMVPSVCGAGAFDDTVSYINAFIGFDEDTLGGEIGSVSDWVYGASNTGTSVIEAISSGGGVTPTSFTRQASMNVTSSIFEGLIQLGAELPKTGKVRIAILNRGTGTEKNVLFGVLAAGSTGWLTGGNSQRVRALCGTAGNPDVMLAYYTFPPSTDGEFGSSENSGINADEDHWIWQRLELDYDTSTFRWHIYNTNGPATGTVRSAAFPVGLATQDFQTVFFSQNLGAAYGTVQIAGIWVNTGGDDWPTT